MLELVKDQIFNDWINLVFISGIAHNALILLYHANKGYFNPKS